MKNLFQPLCCAGVISLFLFSCSPQRGIISTTTDSGTTNVKGPEVISSVNVKVNINALQEEKNEVIDFPVPDQQTLRLVRKRLDRFGNGRFAWFGEIEKDPGSLALLSITSRSISGRISTSKGEVYTINSIGKNVYRVDRVNASALPEKPNDDKEVLPKRSDTSGIDRDCPDPMTQVDIMVLYTEDAETNAGGADGMEAFIYLCIYFTNLSYQNSNVNLNMHLVHFRRVTYTETGNENTDLDRLTETADGHLDDIHALRDSHGADLVSMITETMSGCGLAWRQFPVTAGFDDKGFSVVKRTCAAAGLSFAHETAHNMGARHDCANASNLPDENHGHFVSTPADGSGNSWRTVLSYSSCTSGACTRIPYFSNPNLSYSPTASASTDPLGTAAAAGTCTNDNTSVLNNAANIVSNFRCSSPGVTNVWMRDTWDDTGLQPDPATSGQSMWRSPYIWIRNSAQDPSFLHQHEHENPKMGIDNWIYVKMHNGGVSDNGNLEIYYANASLSLNWPTAWTLLTTVAVSLNANSTSIIEIPWNSLPGEGHYCMIARYSSTADPISVTETTDINYNTRQNNNIIWRNLNIEEMDGDEDENTEKFIVNNSSKKPFSIQFFDEALYPKPHFIQTGKIFVKLNDTLMAAWKQGGSKGKGIIIRDNQIEITSADASIDNIMWTTPGKLESTVRFVKNKQTIPDRYLFTIRQTDDSRRMIAGGISYEIYTYRR